MNPTKQIVVHSRGGRLRDNVLNGIELIAVDLIDYAAATRDGYVARDVLAHNGCRDLLTDSQAHELSDLVEACALGRGTLPATLLADLTTALARAEAVMARNVKAMPYNVHAPANPYVAGP